MNINEIEMLTKGYSKENIILIVKSTHPVTNELIGHQLNASEYFFVSSHLRILKSAKDKLYAVSTVF